MTIYCKVNIYMPGCCCFSLHLLTSSVPCLHGYEFIYFSFYSQVKVQPMLLWLS